MTAAPLRGIGDLRRYGSSDSSCGVVQSAMGSRDDPDQNNLFLGPY